MCAAKIIEDPTVNDNVWEAYDLVKNSRQSNLLAATFKLNDDESEIILDSTV
jgi:hypothetical protein